MFKNRKLEIRFLKDEKKPCDHQTESSFSPETAELIKSTTKDVVKTIVIGAVVVVAATAVLGTASQIAIIAADTAMDA